MRRSKADQERGNKKMYHSSDDDMSGGLRDADETSEDAEDPMDSADYKPSEDFIPTKLAGKGRVKKLRQKGVPGGTELHKRM